MSKLWHREVESRRAQCSLWVEEMKQGVWEGGVSWSSWGRVAERKNLHAQGTPEVCGRFPLVFSSILIGTCKIRNYLRSVYKPTNRIRGNIAEAHTEPGIISDLPATVQNLLIHWASDGVLKRSLPQKRSKIRSRINDALVSPKEKP